MKILSLLVIGFVCIVGYFYATLPLETFKTVIGFFFFGNGVYVVSVLLAALIYD